MYALLEAKALLETWIVIALLEARDRNSQTRCSRRGLDRERTSPRHWGCERAAGGVDWIVNALLGARIMNELLEAGTANELSCLRPGGIGERAGAEGSREQ